MAIANQSTSAGAIVFGTGTTEKMRMTSTGKLSIGNTNDTYTLDVSGTIRGTTSAYFATSSGSVGIGTSSTSAKTEIRGNGNTAINSQGTLFVSSGGTATQTAEVGGQITFGAWLNGDLSVPYPVAAIKGVTESSVTDTNKGALIFATMNSTVNAERMRITSAGNVGIGTSSPSALLTVLSSGTSKTTIGQSRYLDISDNTGAANAKTEIGFGYTNFGAFTNIPAVIGFHQTSTAASTKGDLYFATRDVTTDTAPTERMRIRTDGAISFGSGYQVANSFTYYPNYSAGQPGFTLFSSTATTLLSFNGNTKELFLGNLVGGATTLSVDASGNIIRTGSDVNLKTNVENLQYGLETIMQLRPIIHNWVESANMGEGKSIGFIAQEVETLIPEIVCGIEYKSIDYPKMVAILTKAIQELSKQNEELSNRLIKLENK